MVDFEEEIKKQQALEKQIKEERVAETEKVNKMTNEERVAYLIEKQRRVDEFVHKINMNQKE